MEPRLKQSRIDRIVAFAGLGVFLITATMGIAKLELAPVEPACNYLAEILCLELAVSGSQLGQVIHGPTSVGLWRFHLLIDFPYLVLYGTVLAGGFITLGRGGRFAAVLIVIAALLDAVENVTLWFALDVDPSDLQATVARSAAHTKFFLLAVGSSLGMALLARRADHLGPRIGFGIAATLCAVGLAGPLSPAALQLGGVGLAVALLTLVVGAFRRSRRRPE